MRPLLLYLLLTTLVSGLRAQSNEGNLFWFGFMEHVDKQQNSKVALITARTSTTGTISMPRTGWSATFSVTSQGVTEIMLPQEAETLGSEFINNNGIQITSVDPVSVYIHQYSDFRSEASVVLPVPAIGKEYYAISYQGINVFNNNGESEFLVVATEDETNVSIQVSDETEGGRTGLSTINVILDQGETYQVRGNDATADLTGSYITADKTISVFSGASWSGVPVGCGTYDNLVEQMTPIGSWGTEFVAAPSLKVSFDVFRILAAEDGTTVMIENGSGASAMMNEFNLNRGQFVEFQSSAPIFINSNNPITVAQFNTGQNCNNHPTGIGDPSMVILNSIQQIRDELTLFNSNLKNIEENFITIITKSDEVDLVEFDGQNAISAGFDFTTIGKQQKFAFASRQVTAGAHFIRTDGCGVIASAYGYGEAESYAYGGGASFAPINANPIPDGGCLNDTVFFNTGLPPNRYDVFWDLGNGRTTSEHIFTEFYDQLGNYPTSVIIEDLCLGDIDTLEKDMVISLRQGLTAEEDITICQSEDFQLGAQDLGGATYEWTGPINYFSEDQSPTVVNANPSQSGTYEVIGIISGCATFPQDQEVLIIPTPQPELGVDSVICPRGITPLSSLILNPGDFANYSWSNGSASSALPVLEEGTYWVEVQDSYNCVGRDTVVFERICPTQIFVPNAFSPNNDGNNDFFRAYMTDIISARIAIYDRFGTQIFESDDPNGSWDGKFGGELVSKGQYLWTIEYTGFLADGSMVSDQLGGTVFVSR